MNRTEFWRAPSVIEDMEVQLKVNLDVAATTAIESSQSNSASSSSAAQSQNVRGGATTTTKRGFLGRLANVIAQEKHSSPFEVRGKGGEAGKVVVKVRLEEICLRTVNEFGLYDTLSKPCVTVRVDARC